MSPITKLRFTFTGREYDKDTGLFYYRARYYDPRMGRFLQADPSPGQMSSPRSLLNKYAYAGNGPTNFTDPTGAIFGIDDLLFIGIVALAGGFYNAATTHEGNFFANFLVGALEGAALGASITGVASLLSGLHDVLYCAIENVGFSPGVNFALGFHFLTTLVEYSAAALGAVAAVGIYDPSSGLSGFADAFLIVGGVANLAGGLTIESFRNTQFNIPGTGLNVYLHKEVYDAYAAPPFL